MIVADGCLPSPSNMAMAKQLVVQQDAPAPPATETKSNAAATDAVRAVVKSDVDHLLRREIAARVVFLDLITQVAES